MRKSLSGLEERIGTKFKNKDFLTQALVHRSYLNEHPKFKIGQNERLEFLGDAVLELITTEHLFLKFPDTPEGELTNLRASLVNTKMLYRIAQEISVEDFLFLSKGEAKDKNSKSREYILANSIEALIGAIYLDKNLKECKKFIKKFIFTKLEEIINKKLYRDPKSNFQEKAQEFMGTTPHYYLLKESGPDHNKIFEIGLYVGDELVVKAKGNSKHEAEIKAAEKGLKIKSWL